MKKYKGSPGWFKESHRHSLAAQGIKTGRKSNKKVDYMYSLETIRSMNRERAKEAREEGKKPMIYSGVPEDLRNIPNIGDYRPKGWKLVETYFVDSSGFGSPGEPALTFDEFVEKAKEGKGYAIIEAGQFQVQIGEFEKTNSKDYSRKQKRMSRRKYLLSKRKKEIEEEIENATETSSTDYEIKEWLEQKEVELDLIDKELKK